MPATIIDSTIFGNIFSTDAMKAVWSDENRTQKYLDIEAALARVQTRLGIIPQKAADEIVAGCNINKIDMGNLRAQTERIGYPHHPRYDRGGWSLSGTGQGHAGQAVDGRQIDDAD
jgi:3-carboxy-cis,cis-muconate cycloisomerase